MAGRPAAARGGNGMMYGLVSFAILAVAGLGAFIWQLTLNKKLQDDADRAQKLARDYGTPPAYYNNEKTVRKASSVFAVMNEDMSNLAQLVCGVKDAVYPAMRDQANQIRAEIAAQAADAINPNDTLFTVIQRLFRTLMDDRRTLAQVQQEAEALKAENMQLAGGVKEARDRFEQQIADLKAQVEQLQSEKATALAEKDQQLSERQAQIDSMTEESGRQRQAQQRADTETRILVERLEKQISQLQDKLRIYNPSGFTADDILTKSDGQVLRAIPGSDVVYINLGSRDRIRPGLTFEVFSPGATVAGGFRGKASISVSNMQETTAECRVTRQAPNRPILEGDIIVNIAYERNRKPRFVAIGEFDLNYDGAGDPDGVEKISAIIGDWGGQISETVDETTDFLVVGIGPGTRPLATDRGRKTDVVEAIKELRSEQREAWENAVRTAHDWNIPVLTQNQFLFLTGYTGIGDVGTLSSSN